MTVKIFCDIADINSIKKFNKKIGKRFYNKSKLNEKSWSKRLHAIFKTNFEIM